MPTTWGRLPLQLARAGLVVLAAYLAILAALLPHETLFGLPWLHIGPVAAVTCAAVVGFTLYPTNALSRVAVALVALLFGGRAATLLFVGTPDIDRPRELAGTVAQAVFLILSLLAITVVSLGHLARTMNERGRQWNG
jgi:hypothetical protein